MGMDGLFLSRTISAYYNYVRSTPDAIADSVSKKLQFQRSLDVIVALEISYRLIIWVLLEIQAFISTRQKRTEMLWN
jgi:hypothetical protein